MSGKCSTLQAGSNQRDNLTADLANLELILYEEKARYQMQSSRADTKYSTSTGPFTSSSFVRGKRSRSRHGMKHNVTHTISPMAGKLQGTLALILP